MISIATGTSICLILLSGAVPWPAEESRYGEGEAQCSEPLPSPLLTVMGVKATLGAVRALALRLGKAEVHEEGDAGGSRAWSCWEAANGDGTVVEASQGVMVGWIRVLGREMGFRYRGRCAKSKLVSRHAATAAGGVRLGMKRKAAEKVIGPTSRAGGGWFERYCFARASLTAHERQLAGLKDAEEDSLDSITGIRVVERRGAVVAFEVSSSE